MASKIIKKSKSALLASTATAAVKKSAKPAPAKKAAAPAKKPTGAAALPGRYEEPLVSYSPYAQHRILLEKFGTDEAGQEKVRKHGLSLGLPLTQVNTYIREKLAAIIRDEHKKLGVRPSKPQLEAVKGAKSDDLDIDYKYPTKDAATRALLGIARRANLREMAFHIVKKDGKFAVVAAHVLPDGKPPHFKKGDIVHDCYIDDSRATVIEAGAEVSTIRYDAERKYHGSKETTLSNFYLFIAKPLPAAAKKEPSKVVKKLAGKMAKALAEDMAKVIVDKKPADARKNLAKLERTSAAGVKAGAKKALAARDAAKKPAAKKAAKRG